MFTSCCTLSFTVESMASNKVRTPVNLVAWLSLDRLWLLDQWNNVLQMNGDTTSECPIKPKWGCRCTLIDVLHTSVEVRTLKEVRTLICGLPPPADWVNLTCSGSIRFYSTFWRNHCGPSMPRGQAAPTAPRLQSVRWWRMVQKES